jgi:5S rRNA maturation endonuclease (ribonuclease M5)
MSALPHETQLPEWKQVLAARGILEAALECGWTYFEWYGAAGWSFPLMTFSGKYFKLADGRNAQRWKAIDRANAPQSYTWGYPDQKQGDVKRPADCQYYWAKGTEAAIEDGWGTLYITAGEPDMLSLIAAGRRNVTSFFGEQNIPENLLSDLQKIKVSRVVYLADMDNTGIDAAAKLLNKLEGVIECEVKRLPCKDVNDLWIEHGFNAQTFLEAIDSAPDWTFREPAQTQDQMKPFYNYAAFADAVENALRLPEQKRNGWSKPIPCIFANHSNDDKDPSMGWNYKTHQCRCFKCGETWGCDAVAERVGVNLEDFNENAGKLRVLPAAQGKPPQQAKANEPVVEFVKTSDESLERYIERLDGKHIGDVAAAPFPFTTLHHLGGFCEILKPRKMVGVIGLSGGGKTSFLESMIDVLRQTGEFHTLWWGKEWRWDEMADRAVQRQGGLTMMQVSKYEMHLASLKNTGKSSLNREQLDRVLALIEKSKDYAREMLKWTGKVFYIDKAMDLDDTLEQAQRELDEKKAAGLRVRVAVWDYASLWNVKGARSEIETISRGMGMVKEFGETNDLFTFVSSQPRKDDAERVKAGDKLLSAEDAMYMNDHKYNLLVTINPMYVEGIMQDWGIANVVKNSGGKTGKVALQMDLPRLRWLDQKPSGNLSS